MMQAQNRTRYSLKSSGDVVYVYQLLQHPNLPGKFVAAASDQSIKLYNANRLEIIGQWMISATENIGNTTAQIREISFIDSNIVACAVSDGTVQLFDLRSPSTAAQIISDPSGRSKRPYTCLSVDCEQQVLAAGTEWDTAFEDAQVHLWDLRNPAGILTTLNDSFGDDLTVLRFHPRKQRCLLSGSTDGLCCIFDFDRLSSSAGEEDNCETEYLQAVFNSGSSVSKAGFFGPDGDYVYLMTHVETLSLWSLRTGALLSNLGDVRRPEIMLPGDVPHHQIDYMIDCWYEEKTTASRLNLAAGSFDGSLMLFNLTLKGLQPLNMITAAHPDSVVRSVLSVNGGNSLISGGEDSQLISWSTASSDHMQTAASSGPPSKHSNNHARRQRTAPY